MIFRAFSPKQFVAYWAEIQMLGFADGQMINVQRVEDDFEMVSGAQGDVVLIQNENPIGSVTVRLQAESPVNDQLSAYATISKKRRPMVRPFFMRNLGGTTVCKSAFSIIARIPDIEVIKGSATREWVFLCADIEMFAGGATALPII